MVNRKGTSNIKTLRIVVDIVNSVMRQAQSHNNLISFSTSKLPPSPD
jgi:hypothetical protein